MNKILVKLVTVICLILPVYVSAANEDRALLEEQTIKQLIESAYIDGLYVKRDGDLVTKGFHPEFQLPTLLKDEGKIRFETLDSWMERAGIGKSADELTDGQKARATASLFFKNVEIIGDMASVTADVYFGDRLAFTDFFLLYKADGKWLITGKTFYVYR